MSLKIVRSYTDNGTFGKLYDDQNNFICHTVEQVWKNNQPFKSCIPEGEYTLVRYASNKYGKTFALVAPYLNVYAYEATDCNARYACLIHAANYAGQLQGCIAPGDKLGVVNNEWAVLNSKKTLNRIYDILKPYDLIKIGG